MSTRKGTMIFFERIIREAASVMQEQMNKKRGEVCSGRGPRVDECRGRPHRDQNPGHGREANKLTTTSTGTG